MAYLQHVCTIKMSICFELQNFPKIKILHNTSNKKIEVVATCLFYCPHAIQLTLAPYNSVSAQVFSLTWSPVLVTSVTSVVTLVFLVYPVSRRYRPYVTVGCVSNGVWKVTLCVYGQLGRGLVCIPTTPDSPKDNEINTMGFFSEENIH